MNSAKSFRIDDETAEEIKKLWLKGIQLDNSLRESEIVNFLLKKHIENADINEIIKGKRKRWERGKN